MDLREEGLGRLTLTDVDVSHPWFLHYRRLFSDLEKASVYAHGVLLDVGCGNKPFAEMFRPHIERHVGCDVVQSSECCADVICLANELPFRDGSYDTVLCSQVIEHVADHGALVREAFRVLRSGGVLILSAPMYWPLHEEPYDFFRFTEHGLRLLLESAGYVGVEIVNNGGKWALCGQVLIHAIRSTRLEPYTFLVRIINRFFAYLDDRRPSRGNTINYVAVAKKPVSALGGLK